MFRSRNISALLSVLVMTNLSISTSVAATREKREQWEVDKPECESFWGCNDLDVAKHCKSYDFCKKQSLACGAIELLETGNRPEFKQMLLDLHEHCDNKFTPFKRLYGVPDSLKIKLDVQAGRLPFTLQFHFDGHAGSAPPDGRVKININNKEIYNDLYIAVEKENPLVRTEPVN